MKCCTTVKGNNSTDLTEKENVLGIRTKEMKTQRMGIKLGRKRQSS